MKRPSRGYLAGLFDGEGSVCIMKISPNNSNNQKRTLYVLHVSIVNIDRRPLLEIKNIFGGTIITLPKRRENHIVAYLWAVDGRRAKCFLEYILPEAIIKRKRVKLGILFRGTFPVSGSFNPSNKTLEKRLKIRNKIMALNQHGEN